MRWFLSDMVWWWSENPLVVKLRPGRSWLMVCQIWTSLDYTQSSRPSTELSTPSLSQWDSYMAVLIPSHMSGLMVSWWFLPLWPNSLLGSLFFHEMSMLKNVHVSHIKRCWSWRLNRYLAPLSQNLFKSYSFPDNKISEKSADDKHCSKNLVFLKLRKALFERNNMLVASKPFSSDFNPLPDDKF